MSALRPIWDADLVFPMFDDVRKAQRVAGKKNRIYQSLWRRRSLRPPVDPEQGQRVPHTDFCGSSHWCTGLTADRRSYIFGSPKLERA
ncbi:hypothetical protein GN958_ATG14922 [Phytophthora infestans]|uniref:Uncharacterized protein n=1 Tax=Phytophthora infestans TaxID=4787 RepID=A0A8S9U4T9_PHYIN|nr:hypothetical protein GN958_ATG14922 [Phytophthora infestans]